MMHFQNGWLQASVDRITSMVARREPLKCNVSYVMALSEILMGPKSFCRKQGKLENFKMKILKTLLL